jgi:hypothetical protein
VSLTLRAPTTLITTTAEHNKGQHDKQQRQLAGQFLNSPLIQILLTPILTDSIYHPDSDLQKQCFFR